jgi:hypothetical protein
MVKVKELIFDSVEEKMVSKAISFFEKPIFKTISSSEKYRQFFQMKKKLEITIFLKTEAFIPIHSLQVLSILIKLILL